MTKYITIASFIAFLGSISQIQGQLFDIGLFNMPPGSNCFEVRVRPTATNNTGNWSASAFTIKWSDTYDVNLGSIQTNPYGFIKATASPILNGTFKYQPFSRSNDQFLSWTAGQELVVMTICHTNSLTMGGNGTFEIINDAFTGSNNYNHYQEFAGGDRTGIIYNGAALSPLPLELLAFDIKNTKSALTLSWKTINEQNFEGFELERSVIDADDFKKMAVIPAKGGTFEQSYAYQDFDIQPNLNYYYRLKMNDQNGNYTYSNILSGKIDGVGIGIQISPNPASTELQIEWNGIEAAQVSIMDPQGRILKNHSLNTSEISKINIEDLPTGIYFGRVVTLKNEVLGFKFIKE